MNSAYGNHEYSESGGTAPYKSFFGHSKTYFTYQFRNCFFFVVDDNDFEDGGAPSSQSGSTQWNFIKSEMERVKDDPTIVWRFLITHHPWYGASSQHPRNEGNQVQNYHNLCVTNKVNFVITGHNHNWQRTHVIARNSGSTSSPNVVDNTEPYARSSPGIIHVITGTGGHDSGSGLYSLGTKPPYQAYQNREHNGVWEIVSSDNGKFLTCSFRDSDGTDYDGFDIIA